MYFSSIRGSKSQKGSRQTEGRKNTINEKKNETKMFKSVRHKGVKVLS